MGLIVVIQSHLTTYVANGELNLMNNKVAGITLGKLLGA
jgi:hypothetical protein